LALPGRRPVTVAQVTFTKVVISRLAHFIVFTTHLLKIADRLGVVAGFVLGVGQLVKLLGAQTARTVGVVFQVAQCLGEVALFEIGLSYQLVDFFLVFQIWIRQAGFRISDQLFKPALGKINLRRIVGNIVVVFVGALHQAKLPDGIIVIAFVEIAKSQVVIGRVVIFRFEVFDIAKIPLRLPEVFFDKLGVAQPERYFGTLLFAQAVLRHFAEVGDSLIVVFGIEIIIGYLDQGQVGNGIRRVVADKIQNKLLAVGLAEPHGGLRIAEFRFGV